MTKAKQSLDMDATIKSSYDALVKLISRKLEHKKPGPKAPEYVHDDYDVLERGLAKLRVVAKDPADYFMNKYKDSIFADMLEIGRLTGVRFDRLLDSLMLLSVRYYRGKNANKKKLETEIKKLNKRIQLKSATGLVRAMGVFRSLTPAERFVVRENAK